MGILEFAEDRESICEDDHIGLGSRHIVSYLNCSFLRASASALKLVEYFPVAMVIFAIPSLYLMYTPPPPSRVASAAEPSV